MTSVKRCSLTMLPCRPAGLARNPETAQLQEKVWVELIAKLEIIEPGISQNI